MSVFIAAILCALIYHFTVDADLYGPNVMLSRPIVCGALVGLVLGDLKTGVILGAQLEIIFMGIVAIGTSAGANTTGSAIICVAFAILFGITQEEAIALAFPLGVVIQVFKNFDSAIADLWQPITDKQIEKDNRFMYGLLASVGNALRIMSGTLLVFLAIMFGGNFVQSIMNNMPEFIMTGVQAFGTIMPGLGMAMMMNLMFNKKVAIFFILGYFITVYTKIDVLFLTIIAISIAVLDFFYFNDKNTTAQTLEKNNAINDSKEDFLS